MDNHELDTLNTRLNTIERDISKILELLHVRGDYKTGTIPEEKLDPGYVHELIQKQTED